MTQYMSDEEVDRLLAMDSGMVTPVPDSGEFIADEEIDRLLAGGGVELEEPAPERTWSDRFKDFRTGLAGSAIKTYIGIKDLLGLEGELDDAVRDMVDEDIDEGGMAAVLGSVTGDIAQMAIPGGAALRGARAAQRGARGLNQLRRVGIDPTRAGRMVNPEIAAAAGVAGTYGGLQKPEEGDTRLGNALRDAAIGAAGGYLGGKAIEGLAKTREATRMLREGVYLTPGQAAESTAVRGVEAVMDVVPILARGTKAARARAGQDYTRKAIDTVKPPGSRVELSGTPHERMRGLKEAYKKAYDDAWNTATGVGDVSKSVGVLARGGRGLGKKKTRLLNNLSEEISSAGKAREVDDAFRKVLKRADVRNDPDLAETVRAARTQYRDTLGPDTKRALAEIDAMYPSYKTVQRASRNATEGEFTPKQLETAARAIGKDQAAYGMAPMQDFAETGLATVGRRLGGQPLEWMRRVAEFAPSPLPMQTMGNAMLGQTLLQRGVMQPGARALAERGVTPGTVTAGFFGE